MKLEKSIYPFISLSLLFQLACSPKLSPIDIRSKQEENVHLVYEKDRLEGFLLYEGFVVQFNEEKRVPNYTIHRISPEQLSDSSGIAASRKNSPDFIVDPRIREYSALRSDYYKSGYDRGHHVPAGDFVYSQQLKDETFSYGNVSPQTKELNRYGWKYLEMSIRKSVKACHCNAYVITGTSFQAASKTIGENKVGVPTHLYKVVFFPKKEKMYAFLMENNSAKYEGSFETYQLTVDELEALLELNFFENLKDEDENRLESQLKKYKK